MHILAVLLWTPRLQLEDQQHVAIVHRPIAGLVFERIRPAFGIVRVILGALCERGLLHRFDSPDGEADQAAEPGYALARAADAIRVSELLDVGYLLANGGPVEADLSEGASAQEGELMRRLRAAQIAAAGDQTLADVVRSGSTPAKANVGGEAPAALSSALTRTPTNGTAPRPAIVPLGSEPTGMGGAHRPE